MSTLSSTISSYRKRFGHDGRSASRQMPGACGGPAPAACETVDSTRSGAVSAEFKASRATEKAQVQSLNDRFCSYTEKVRMLEQRNEAMRAELERWRGNGPSRLSELYAHEVAELRRHVDRLTNEKARVEVQRDNLLVDLERIRAKCVRLIHSFSLGSASRLITALLITIIDKHVVEMIYKIFFY